MSESVEELVPLAPTESEASESTAQVEGMETEGAEAAETKPPVFDKAMQRFQQKYANQAREIAELKQMIVAQANKPQTAAVRDRLETMLEEAKAEYGDSNPGIMKIVNALTEEIREGRTTRADLQQKLDDMRGASSYADFMAGRTPDFKAEFSEAQTELEAAAIEESGKKPSPMELRLAMTLWTRNWDKQHATTKTAPARSGTGRAQIVPTGSGPRNKSAESLEQILASGRVPDGKGGAKSGNLLGI